MWKKCAGLMILNEVLIIKASSTMNTKPLMSKPQQRNNILFELLGNDCDYSDAGFLPVYTRCTSASF